MKSQSTPYQGTLHGFAVFTACATFILIIAGALVTSNDAGLSVPDWPTSFGSLYKIPRMVGGVRFEHTHRMIAEFIGLLTIVIAIWTWRSDRRRWMKGLGITALGTVIAQGVLGGITVLHFLPPAISSAHAALGQTFFCVAVAIALFSGRNWVEEAPQLEEDQHRPTLFTLSLLSLLVLYLQLFLGAMFRHHGNELVAASGQRSLGCRCSHLDRDSRADAILENSGGPSSRHADNLAAGHTIVSGISGFHHSSGLGTRRCSARISHGDIHRRSRRRRCLAVGYHDHSDDSGLAVCSRLRERTRPECQGCSGLGMI